MIKKVDETNKAIIKLLCDGRRAYSSIATELGITENTVRSRVNKLIEDGVLDIAGLVDIKEIPGFQLVIMGVKLRTMDLERKAREFTSLRGVINAMVVTGRYDLIVQIEICEDDGLSLLDFFKNELTKISEIAEVESFVVYQSVNLKVPYLL
jgi:Transcriptional regulators